MAPSSGEANHETFEGLYNQHRLQILAYCNRRLDQTLAPDACSEVFLVAWRRYEEIPDPPESLFYLYGIAAKVVANQRRSMRRKVRLDAKLRNIGVAPSDDPSAMLIRSEQDRWVERAVAKLNPTDREIVMLYAWEELSREEISKVMGMSRSAIDQRIHRAYRRLARRLAPAVPQLAHDPLTHGGNR